MNAKTAWAHPCRRQAGVRAPVIRSGGKGLVILMEDAKKTELFENMPIPKAVMQLAIPTVISSLVMVIYNLADTYFVGMLNDPIQNAAVTLARRCCSPSTRSTTSSASAARA